MAHDREPARSSLYDTDFYTWTRVQAYENAREEAIIETGLPGTTFPAASDLSLEQLRDKEFLPAPVDLSRIPLAVTRR